MFLTQSQEPFIPPETPVFWKVTGLSGHLVTFSRRKNSSPPKIMLIFCKIFSGASPPNPLYCSILRYSVFICKNCFLKNFAQHFHCEILIFLTEHPNFFFVSPKNITIIFREICIIVMIPYWYFFVFPKSICPYNTKMFWGAPPPRPRIFLNEDFDSLLYLSKYENFARRNCIRLLKDILL